MKMLIESTDKLTSLDGVQVRAWKGTTASGVPCHIFVHRIAVRDGKDCAQFDAEVKEQLQPGVAVPLRQIL